MTAVAESVRSPEGSKLVRACACHCTFAVTDELPLSVNVHVLLLLPPLEQAPDQIASRSFVILSVIDVPTLNDADPVLPTVTLIPPGSTSPARRCGRWP